MTPLVAYADAIAFAQVKVSLTLPEVSPTFGFATGVPGTCKAFTPPPVTSGTNGGVATAVPATTGLAGRTLSYEAKVKATAPTPASGTAQASASSEGNSLCVSLFNPSSIALDIPTIVTVVGSYSFTVSTQIDDEEFDSASASLVFGVKRDGAFVSPFPVNIAAITPPGASRSETRDFSFDVRLLPNPEANPALFSTIVIDPVLNASATAIPEPSLGILLALGGLAAIRRRRRSGQDVTVCE
jgi:hypothetical protein